MTKRASAPGKIILSGEYAVVFGYPGLAVPSSRSMTVSFQEDLKKEGITMEWEGASKPWLKYWRDTVELCRACMHLPGGTLTMECDLPLGKGMGASTALVIATARCLLGNACETQAMAIEDSMNPGHSGLDFAVIWHGKALRFQKHQAPDLVGLPPDLLEGALLIDTGEPKETTPQLITWIDERCDELRDALETIGSCTDRIIAGEDLANIMRTHHRAQVELGIVPEKTAKLIDAIERAGGAAKVIGAGGRTGGGGMVLALGVERRAIPKQFPVMEL